MKHRAFLSFFLLFTGIFLSEIAQADIIAYTSFEEPGLGSMYYDMGDAETDHALASNRGESSVNYTSVGGELGFLSFYTNTRNDVGLTDGDYVGVTDYTPVNGGSYTDGSQGFEMQDADGMMTLTLDTVDLSGYTNISVSLDLFVSETGWETSDSIRTYLTVDGSTEIDLLNTGGSDIDDLYIEGNWMTLTGDLNDYTSATLSISLDSNAASEAIFVDNIVFEGSPVPVPGAIWLLGSGLLGIFGITRKNA